MRREAFEAVGGFDAERYPYPSIEDVELGVRLAATGARIRLDPAIQGTHLKAWTLRDMMLTDIRRRGTPWIALMLRSGESSGALNLGWRNRLSALAALATAVGIARRRPATAAAGASALVLLNGRFYALLLRRLGPVRGATGVALHTAHLLAAAIAVPLGVAAHLRERATQREREPEQ